MLSLKVKMRICIDIDGTICSLKEEGQVYRHLSPLQGAALKIKSLRAQGCYIIFCTARHMKTCNSNIGMVIAREGQALIEWLKENEFEYDELWFGKPYAHVYIDDKALQFKGSWDEIDISLIQKYL